MWAVLSDIHANLEALEAVLDDIAKHPVTNTICLGDILGYGPSPLECLVLAMPWSTVILGNHDAAVLTEPDGFGVSAEKAVHFHRAVLDSCGRTDPHEFLAIMQRSHRRGDFHFVHGSPRNPQNEYVFPEDVYNLQKMSGIFALIDRYCFAGHTHVPGIFPNELQFVSSGECSGKYRLDKRKTLVNVGSVGQPRDGDWRACYVLVDGLDVTFRRVEYDVDATVQKIYDIPELDNFLGDRLREGR